MDIGVIGAGECFREKIGPALNSLGDFSVKWVVEVLPEEEVRQSMRDSGLPDDFLYTVPDADGFLHNLPDLDVDAVFDTSPSRYHASNISLSLNSGIHVYAEKPFSINRDNILQVRDSLHANPDLLAYFSEYYRDEKGLGFRVLLGEILPGDWYEQFIEPGIDPQIRNALDSLQPIKRIYGTCLEGVGKKSGISHRLWVGDRDQGGQLLDMSTHLITFPVMLHDVIGDLSLTECIAGVCEEAKIEYAKKTGREISETYAETRFKSGSGCNIEFKFGKYTGVAERALIIEGENGTIRIDFETQVMQVDTPSYKGNLRVISDPKYNVIVRDFARRLGDSRHHLPYMFDVSSRTLGHIIEARENVSRTFVHKAGDLKPIGYL